MAIDRRFGSTTLRNLIHMRVSDAEVPVIFGAKMTATDGKSIFVSDLPDSEDPGLRLMAEVAAYHEAEHVRVLKDLTAEGWFKGVSPTIQSMNKKFVEKFPVKFRSLAANVINVYEDLRIDNRANTRYPGTTEKYRDACAALWEKGKGNFSKMGPVDKSLFMTLYKNRDLYYKEHLLDPIEITFTAADESMFSQTLGPLVPLAGQGTYDDCMALATKAMNILIKAFTPPPEPPPQQGGKDDSKDQDKSDKKDEPSDGGKGDKDGAGKPDSGAMGSDPKKDDGRGPEQGDGKEDPSDDTGSGQSPDGDASGTDSVGSDGPDGGGDGAQGGAKDPDSGRGPKQSGDDGASDATKGSDEPDDSGSGGDDPGDGSDVPDEAPQPAQDKKGAGKASSKADGKGKDKKKVKQPGFQGFGDPDELTKSDGVNLNKDIMDCVNKQATAFYTVDPSIKDRTHDHTKPFRNGCGLGPMLIAEGNRYFAGTEAKIRKLLVDERAPKVRDSLRSGKKLDTNHLYRHEDMKRGKMPLIWKTVQEGTRIDTAVFIGLDESGSMAGLSWHTITRITAALTRILDSLSAKYLVVGFDADGSHIGQRYACQRSHVVNFMQYNRWGTRLDPNVLATTPHGGNTPTADIVSAGLKELASRPEVRKVFLLLTDGAPNYENNGTVIAAMAMAGERLEQARKCGVKTFGFGIDIGAGTSTADVMHEMFLKGWVNLPHFSSDAAKHASTIIHKLEEAFRG